ncbi:MAG: hypothetical protein E2594_21570 [Pseudomonas sp.]|nr:hypothetical protein [Pseudomonas sp.]
MFPCQKCQHSTSGTWSISTKQRPFFWANTYLDVKKDLKGRYPKLPRDVA